MTRLRLKIEHINPGGIISDLFGNYIPGLCAGRALASQDLAQALAASNDPLLTILNANGIRGSGAFAAGVYGFKARQPSHLNACDLCTEIRFWLA